MPNCIYVIKAAACKRMVIPRLGPRALAAGRAGLGDEDCLAEKRRARLSLGSGTAGKSGAAAP